MAKKRKATPLTLEDLSKKDLEELEKLSKKWQKRFAARKRAIKASGDIRAKDLALIVRAGPTQVRLSAKRTRQLFETGCPAGEELGTKVFRFTDPDNISDIRIG
jgi:hypothetical protein